MMSILPPIKIGLVGNYKVNRPLTEEEIANRLEQKGIDNPWPKHKLSVIRMNSTYLECVDKFYEGKGDITFRGLAGFIFGFAGLVGFIFIASTWNDVPSYKWSQFIALLIFIFVMSAGFLIFSIRVLLRKELFCYTHYPQRFNRKTRKVHVFRFDGTVMTEDWDKLFFTLGKADEFSIWDIRGHRLAEDGNTVLETFALAHHDSRNERDFLSQWELIRSYMEEGPEKLMRTIWFAHDIVNRKETPWMSLKLEMATTGNMFFMIPINLIYAFCRILAVKTSKIPRWPDEIEAQCQVDPDDPYIRDAQHLAPPKPKK